MALALQLARGVEPFRLVTLHPAMVHVALGVLPLALFAYWVAAARGSERWAFVGDCALVTSALAAVASAITGMISFVLVPWVGSSGPWRWIHLGGGIAAAVLLAALAAYRLRLRRRVPGAGRVLALAATAVAALTAVTGWIGGEILVYRGGAGVTAAAGGSLGPPVGPAAMPHTMVEYMDRLRERWAEATTDTAYMVAVAPAKGRFARIARDADVLADTASRLGHAQLASGEHDVDPEIENVERAARTLAAAARSQDLPAVANALATTSGACARCHDDMR